MDAHEIVATLGGHQQGTVSSSALARAVVGYPHWHVPSRHAAEGVASIWMFPGAGGQWWVCAFSSLEALATYESLYRVTIGERHTVLAGASLVEQLPRIAHGVGLDPGSSHAVTLYSPAIAQLRELGVAQEVEAVLLGRSNKEDQFERLRAYCGYRICWQGPNLMLAPDAKGRRLAAVFTAEDALEAYVARHGSPVPAARTIDGRSLFEQLRHAPIDGIVFNCSGPVPPKAVARAFSEAVLKGVDRPPEPPGSADSIPPRASAIGAAAQPAIARAVSSRHSVSEYLPRLVRQDAPELAHGIVARPLVAPTEPTQPIVSPMVCLAVETPEGPAYATPKTLGTQSLGEVVSAGAQRLFANSPPSSRLLGNKPGVLCCAGAHAAECLLVPELVQSFHKKLGATELVAALPVRGVVIVCGMNNPSALVRMGAMAERAYRAAGDRGLFAHLVLLVGGKLTGRVSIELEPPAAAQSSGGAAPSGSTSPKPGTDAPRVVGPLEGRSLAECELYLSLRGYPESARTHSIASEGDHVVARYECTKPGELATRFEFVIRLTDMAATSGAGPFRYGSGSAPSRLVDAGQFFELAEGNAKAGVASPDGLPKEAALIALGIIERAAAAMDEVLKFIPEGQEKMPDEAFFTPAGNRTRAAQPAGRWSRARLGAIGGAYRGIAQRFREHALHQGWLTG